MMWLMVGWALAVAAPQLVVQALPKGEFDRVEWTAADQQIVASTATTTVVMDAQTGVMVHRFEGDLLGVHPNQPQVLLSLSEALVVRDLSSGAEVSRVAVPRLRRRARRRAVHSEDGATWLVMEDSKVSRLRWSDLSITGTHSLSKAPNARDLPRMAECRVPRGPSDALCAATDGSVWRWAERVWPERQPVPQSVALDPQGLRVAWLDPTRVSVRGVDDKSSGWSADLEVPRREQPRRVVFSPDGGRLVVFSGGRIQVHDAATGAVLRSWQGIIMRPSAVAFTELYLVVANGGDVVVWSREHGGLLAHQRVATGAVAVSHDGTSLAVAGSRVRRLSIRQPGLFWQTRPAPLRADQAALSPNGRWLLVRAGRSAMLWDLGRGLHRVTSPLGGRGTVGGIVGRRHGDESRPFVRWSPDSRGYAAFGVGSDGFWNVEDQALTRFAGSGWSRISFRADGASAITTARRGKATIWNLDRGTKGTVVQGGRYPGSGQISDDGRYVWFRASQEVTVSSGRTGERLWSKSFHRESITVAGVAADGRTLVVGGSNGRTILFDIATGQQRREIKGLRAWTLDPQGKHFVATLDQDEWAWVSVSGALRYVRPGRQPWLAPDGRTVITQDQAGTSTVWNAATGAKRFDMPVKTLPSRIFSATADGRTLAVVTDQGNVALWDLQRGIERARITMQNLNTWWITDTHGRWDAASAEPSWPVTGGVAWVHGGRGVWATDLGVAYHQPGLLAHAMGLAREPMPHARPLTVGASTPVRRSPDPELDPPRAVRVLAIGVGELQGEPKTSAGTDAVRVGRGMQLAAESIPFPDSAALRILSTATDPRVHAAPTKDAVREGLAWLAQAGPDDAVIVYLAGYGSTAWTKAGARYSLHLPDGALRLRSVTEALKATPTLRRWLIVDTAPRASSRGATSQEVPSSSRRAVRWAAEQSGAWLVAHIRPDAADYQDRSRSPLVSAVLELRHDQPTPVPELVTKAASRLVPRGRVRGTGPVVTWPGAIPFLVGGIDSEVRRALLD